MESLGGRAAERAGVPQALQQGATWIGGRDYTGLVSQPIPLVDVLNRRARHCCGQGHHAVGGMVAACHGHEPLLRTGGLVAGLSR